MSEYVIGQPLFFVSSHPRGGAREVKVTKVGRKWVETDFGPRFHKDTRQADGKGFSSPGRFWSTKAEFQSAKDISDAWRTLKYRFSGSYSIPDHLTVDDIRQATKVLFGEA